MSILYARDITHIQHSLNLCLYQNETSALTHFDVPNGLVAKSIAKTVCPKYTKPLAACASLVVSIKTRQ